MSKREANMRHHLIIKKIRTAKHATFEEITNYLKKESDFRGRRRAAESDNCKMSQVSSIAGQVQLQCSRSRIAGDVRQGYEIVS